MRILFMPLVAVIFLSVSCVHASGIDEEDMRILGSALTKLSKSVESTVRYKPYADDISAQELLEKATSRRPILLEPFAGYSVLINRVGKDSSVLVCNADKSQALIEDAGCTGTLDGSELWDTKPQLPCEFTLDVTGICANR